MLVSFIAFTVFVAISALGLRFCFSQRAQRSNRLMVSGAIMLVFGGIIAVLLIEQPIQYLVTPLRWSMTLVAVGAFLLLPPSQIPYEERRLTVRQRFGMAVFFTGAVGIVILFSYGLLPNGQTDYFSQLLLLFASCLC